MPDKEPIERAKRDKRQGKAPSTQAGEFVREEIEHVREGKHGARSTKQRSERSAAARSAARTKGRAGRSAAARKAAHTRAARRG